jgi:hypothetical protein
VGRVKLWYNSIKEYHAAVKKNSEDLYKLLKKTPRLIGR